MTHERPTGTPSEARWGFVMDPTLLELPHRVGPSMIGTKGSKLAALIGSIGSYAAIPNPNERIKVSGKRLTLALKRPGLRRSLRLDLVERF